MDANAYQRAALRTAPTNLDKKSMLVNGTLGLVGESGEIADMVKKHLFQGHDLDVNHVKRELGDISWYLAIAADAIGCSLNDVFQTNVDKLMKRYPEGFDSNRSINRNPDDI